MKKILYHPFFVVAITIIALIIIFNLKSKLNRLTISQENLKAIQQEVTQVETDLQANQILLEKSQRPIAEEKLTRSELLMQKENELIIKLPDIEEPVETVETATKKTPLAQWKELFFGKNM